MVGSSNAWNSWNLYSYDYIRYAKSRSHASDPKPSTHERLPSSSRKPTERTSAARSAQKDRIAPRFPAPGLTVTTRKIAARVSGIATGCGCAGEPSDAKAFVIGKVSIFEG